MPYEVIQYPNTSPDDSGTEITVHWSKDSHVQLEVVRHVWGHVCRNGCDGINTGCSECPRGTTPEFDKGKEFGAPAIVGHSVGPCGAYGHPGGAPWRCSLREGHIGDHAAVVDGSEQATWPNDTLSLATERTVPGLVNGDTDTPEQMPVSSDLPAQIWTQILTRQEINKMIRVLRRARDHAYGQDA